MIRSKTVLTLETYSDTYSEKVFVNERISVYIASIVGASSSTDYVHNVSFPLFSPEMIKEYSMVEMPLIPNFG